MRGVLIQIYSALTISIGNFLGSHAIAWSSYTLETLENDQSPIGARISKNEESLLGSLPMLGSLVSTLYVGWLTDAIGRKRTIILTALLYTLSWAIVASTSNITLMLTGRFLVGLASGMQMVSVIYVSEIAQTSIRGTLSSILIVSYSCGSLVSYITGWLCSYAVTNYFPLVLSVVYTVLMCFLKESPAFLMTEGKDKAALKSLKFYRGCSKKSQKLLAEYAKLQTQRRASIKSNTDLKLIGASEPEQQKLRLEVEVDLKTISAWKLLMMSKPNQRAIITITIFFLLLVSGGTIAVMAYAGKIFTQASPTLSPHLCAVFVALATAVGSMLSAFASELVGRRTLYMTSCALSSSCLALLASLLRWRWLGEWWVPATLLGYCFAFQIGAASVPFVQLAETFVPKLKSLTTNIVLVNMWIANFIVLAVYGPAVDVLGLDGTFLMFSLVCAASTLVAYLMMRETKGVPVEEIQDMYAEGYIVKRFN